MLRVVLAVIALMIALVVGLHIMRAEKTTCGRVLIGVGMVVICTFIGLAFTVFV